jgi:hypothetical protein
MLFSIVITVPSSSFGWKGTVHLPTIQIQAPTKQDAINRVHSILYHLPKGSTFSLEAI